MSRDATIFHRTSDAGAARRSWSGLTPDLLENARGRVRTLAWLMLVVLGLGAVIDTAYAAVILDRTNPIWVGGIGMAGIAMSVGLVVIATRESVDHLTVLRLGLAYEVVICFLFAVTLPWMLYLEHGNVPYITWVTPLIILFPLIVPSPPRVTLVVAVAAAATRPLGLLVMEKMGGFDLSPLRYIDSSISPFLAAALAYVGSRIVHGLNVDLARARRLGSYTLETRLGAGGMGEVWRAQHQLLARPAAVKLIRPEIVARDPEHQGVMLARFEREAQVTAAMSSPHTVQLYDFGIEQRGAFYYVMELLNGLDLDALVTRFGALPPARAVHLLRQACDSLGEAHEHGLIHRDVKPANIYVCRYGRRVDFVKVLDFGLVKSRHQGDEADPALTAEQTVGGTPAFIAPEQVTGNDVDGRADIYSLGCVAYWMITGTFVFKMRSAFETMMMHVRDTPEAPTARTEQPVPAGLERVVLSCLEKEPARRPQTVDELADLLSGLALDDTWTEERAREWWELHLPAG
jgi:serine/threonine-protein kinase